MKLKYVIIVMASVALFSCSKAEDGAIGPIGPAGQIGPVGQNGADGTDGLNGGVDGTDGVDGINGTNGTDGQDGNANVISSGWFTFESTDWSFNGVQTTVTAQKDEPEITQEIRENGAILAYIDLGPGNSGVYSLPRVENFAYTFYSNQVGEISFRHYKLDGSTVSSPSTQFKFRYVIIPASISGKSSIDFEKMTYEEVIDYFGLEY